MFDSTSTPRREKSQADDQAQSRPLERDEWSFGQPGRSPLQWATHRKNAAGRRDEIDRHLEAIVAEGAGRGW